MTDHILDVDLLAFESGSPVARMAVVEGVMASLKTGFVYTSHDLGDGLLDDAYAMLGQFFAADQDTKQAFHVPGGAGQTGYTGLAVETAVGAAVADWKEMLNWSQQLPAAHPLRREFPTQYCDQVLPDAAVPGIGAVLTELHRRLLDLQVRFLRVIAVGLGASEGFFDDMCKDGATLTRAIRYPAMEAAPGAGYTWAAEHADINLITALPRASAPGLQVLTVDGWADAAPPDGHVIINTGIMLERLTNGVIGAGWHRVVAHPDQSGERLSVVQFCHPAGTTVLAPLASTVDAEHPQRYAGVRAGDLLARVLYDLGLATAEQAAATHRPAAIPARPAAAIGA
jgi:isopenicillin N synthase-like dioxygenase